MSTENNNQHAATNDDDDDEGGEVSRRRMRSSSIQDEQQEGVESDTEEVEENDNYFSSSDDEEVPPLVDLGRGDEQETDDETDDDEQETDRRDDIRVTELPARLIPLQIWDDGEEAGEEETNGAMSTSIHTGETLQQRNRRGWTLGTRGMNRYLRNTARGDHFIARIISGHPTADLPSFQLYSSGTASFILEDGLRRYYRQDMGLTNTEFSALYRRVRYYQRGMDLTDYEFMRHLNENPELINRFTNVDNNEEKEDDDGERRS